MIRCTNIRLMNWQERDKAHDKWSSNGEKPDEKMSCVAPHACFHDKLLPPDRAIIFFMKKYKPKKLILAFAWFIVTKVEIRFQCVNKIWRKSLVLPGFLYFVHAKKL